MTHQVNVTVERLLDYMNAGGYENGRLVMLGAVKGPHNASYTQPRICWQLKDSGVMYCIVASKENLERLREFQLKRNLGKEIIRKTYEQPPPPPKQKNQSKEEVPLEPIYPIKTTFFGRLLRRLQALVRTYFK